MDFSWSAEQEALRDTIARFAREQVAPVSSAIDRDGAIPSALLAALAKVGLLSMGLPADLGGSGASSVDLGIVVEELAAADFAVSQLPIMGALTATAIAQAAPAVRDSVLPSLLAGTDLVAFALTEPGAGSDAARITCRARRTDRGYLLAGEKTSVSNLSTARGIIVLARLDGAAGLTAFYVPRTSVGLAVALFDDLGCRGLSRGSLALSDVEVPGDHLIGLPGRGLRLVLGVFDLTRTLIALAAVGTARAAMDDASGYAQQRESMGVPIIAHQGVSFVLAEHATMLEAARWLCYRALWLRDAGQPHTTEAAMCKWWGVQTAVAAIHAAMLLHGHAGYTRDLPQQQRLRDVIGMEWGDGTAQIQKLVVARSLSRAGDKERNERA
jgi:cyclohexanecarboxyl-CoA dehydrogenase